MPYWQPNLELLQQLAPELILCDPTVDRALRSIAPSEVVDIYPTEQGVWHSASAFTLRLAARLELESRAIADLQVANERLEALAKRLASRPRPPLCIVVLNQDGRHATV